MCGFRPMALRPRLSPGLPFSLRTWKGAGQLKSEPRKQTRFAVRTSSMSCLLRRPGDHGRLRGGRPIGFASPAFAGFAFSVVEYAAIIYAFLCSGAFISEISACLGVSLQKCWLERRRGGFGSGCPYELRLGFCNESILTFHFCKVE